MGKKNGSGSRGTQRCLHLFDELRLPGGRMVRRLFEDECFWHIVSEALVVAQEVIPPSGPHLVGREPEVRQHVRYHLTWAIEVPTDGRPLRESRARDVYRVPIDRAYVCSPMVQIGEGRTEQWVPAAQAAERAAELAAAERGDATEH